MKSSATVKAVEVPGTLTFMEVTTGQVCWPSEGKSLDCTRKPARTTVPGESDTCEGGIWNTVPSPVVSTFAANGAGGAPCSPPIRVIPGRPFSVHVETEEFTIPTPLKIWPAVPLAFMAMSFSWLAVQGEGEAGSVVVVVVDDVLGTVVTGGLVVVVDVGGEVVAGLEVVVAGATAFVQPAAAVAKPSIMANRLATTVLDLRMSLLVLTAARQT